MENAIETVNLTKIFGRFGKRLTAVNNLNLSIEKGTVYGFIGPNGAGKTTTIKMLVGAMRATKGKASILGHSAGTVKAKASIGYSSEHPNFYSMSAVDFLVYSAKLCGMPQKEARSKADELLAWMGLENFRDRNARNFSSGMKQKLSIVQALIHDPEILILDEPTANLDPIGRHEVLDKIRALATKQNKTIFVSSHILQELEKVVDHVAIVNKGNAIMQGDMTELRKKFSEKHFVVDTTNNEKFMKTISGLNGVEKAWMNQHMKIEATVKNPLSFKKALFSAFKGHEQDLTEFAPFTMSLENIFMKVIEKAEGENHGLNK
ncbi:MAG: ABC transporter ATP-binding protein [Candidatus Altiarchaeota archaeon]|nr:ABC transporter ATP-binding protein [Candidatus Altiarchaeota archaeon]